jgi:hypothetical protein
VLQIGDEVARTRTTLDYRLRPDLTVGLEFNGQNSEVQPRATWFAVPGRRGQPSVTLGLASDRLSTPRGQALFLTSSLPIGATGVLPFVSLKWSSDSRRVMFPFGVNLSMDRWTLQTINDGNYTHFLFSRGEDWGAVSLVLARAKHPGLSISFGF